MSVAELTTKVSEAKKAYKANKDDKSLKKAYKALKEELEAAKAAEAAAASSKKRKADSSSDEEEQKPAKKAKVVDIAALEEAAKAAKKAYKANKEDKSLKVAYKAAKEELENAKANAGAAPAEEKTEEAAPADDLMASLNKKKEEKAAAPPANATSKVFCGNISWDMTDEIITDFFKDCGVPTDIHWLTDRDSGKFKGCGFVEFETVEAATKACALNETEVMGRPIKINYATPRAGGGNKGGKSKFGDRPMSEKPEGCTTVFAGNLSFQIDDDQMHEFAKDCGEIKSIRWLTDRDTGSFKGCGFIEFFKTEAVDEFVKKNGNDLLGRAIRLDYAKARAPRE